MKKISVMIMIGLLLVMGTTAVAAQRMYFRCSICGTTCDGDKYPYPGYCFSNNGGPHNWVRYR